MPLYLLDDVFLLNLALEAAKRILQRLALLQSYFCQTKYTPTLTPVGLGSYFNISPLSQANMWVYATKAWGGGIPAALAACGGAWYLVGFLFMLRAYKGMRPKIAASCYVDQSAQLIGDVVLAENSSVWMNAVLRGDVNAIRIGANSNVQDCSVLHGMKDKYAVTVGEWVTVGHSVTLHGCTVANRCLIGMGAVILNNATIGEGSIIAAGTLVPENTVVEPGSLWMGVPGKFRKRLGEEDQKAILRYAKNYLEYKDQYLSELSS
jgi:carbonic anhydrase/acetyltransferase-like protein (isoleucine patch superfamily)